MMTAVRCKALIWMLTWMLMVCTAGLAADIVIVDVQPDRAPAAGQTPHSPARRGKGQALEPAKNDTYLIQYIDYDDTILAEIFIAQEDQVTVPSVIPERSGFVFLYWYDEATTGGPSIPYVFGAQLTGDLRLHALYAEIPLKSEHSAPPPLEASSASLDDA